MIDLRLTALVSAGLFIAGCQGDAPQAPSVSGACIPEKAQSLTGQARVSDEQARQITGAGLVRQIGPGDPVTMDYNPNRVTIETDPTSGTIVRASCG